MPRPPAHPDEHRAGAHDLGVDLEVEILAENETSAGDDASTIRGPHAWLNWQAASAGQPARTDSRVGILIVPLWEEYGLYSDAPFTGELEFGPCLLMLAFPARRPTLGRCELSLILRTRDHLASPPADEAPRIPDGEDVAAYAGGNIGDEIASLISLALTKRVRSGGPIRRGEETDPKGKPFFARHHAPSLSSPRHAPMLPSIAAEVDLGGVEPYLKAYAAADSADAVAVLRAAHQYADALWLADADPRIAWIKLFGALEAAANQWDVSVDPDPVAQLRRRMPGLCRNLDRKAPDAIPIVAKSISRIVGAQSKMLDFVRVHAPQPPAVRAEIAQFDWPTLEDALVVLYHHRSADLHGGVPFPAPLCEPPHIYEGVAIETFPALAATAGGGSWPADRLPMYLHTFAHVVGESLRTWWRSLAPTTDSAPQESPRDRQGDGYSV